MKKQFQIADVISAIIKFDLISYDNTCTVYYHMTESKNMYYMADFYRFCQKVYSQYPLLKDVKNDYDRLITMMNSSDSFGEFRSFAIEEWIQPWIDKLGPILELDNGK
jgi:hypothetical protein